MLIIILFLILNLFTALKEPYSHTILNKKIIEIAFVSTAAGIYIYIYIYIYIDFIMKGIINVLLLLIATVTGLDKLRIGKVKLKMKLILYV